MISNVSSINDSANRLALILSEFPGYIGLPQHLPQLVKLQDTWICRLTEVQLDIYVAWRQYCSVQNDQPQM